MYVCCVCRLDLQLPPAFAAASIRRLQSSMATLAPPQLARMLWSFAKSGYTFLPQQLDAYQARVSALYAHTHTRTRTDLSSAHSCSKVSSNTVQQRLSCSQCPSVI